MSDHFETYCIKRLNIEKNHYSFIISINIHKTFKIFLLNTVEF